VRRGKFAYKEHFSMTQPVHYKYHTMPDVGCQSIVVSFLDRHATAVLMSPVKPPCSEGKSVSAWAWLGEKLRFINHLGCLLKLVVLGYI
jgi:hypothetical protein